ncbi:MAG: hypothetical protein DRG20_04465 [Deltaproteobacteria bacterium]|nr:MAG: hypothetical protein DRG20_04465 [Deltaproteobacteria bacterium]
MKRSKFKLSIVLIIIFLFSFSFAFSADKKIVEIYNNIAKMSQIYTPEHYAVKVINKKFEEALKELPEDVLISGKKPYVLIDFTKGKGVRILIENIKDEYKSLFSMYEDYFKFSGISKVQNPMEFKEIIDQGVVKFYKEDKNYVIVQAWDPEKKDKKDDYALFYLDKKMWIIKKAIYYIDGTPYVEAINHYEKIGKYYLPTRIELKSLTEEGGGDVFYFKDYQFKN